MTSVPNNIYPDYCHSLSPTIGKWCPLLATDVHRLKTVGMFSDGMFVSFPIAILQVSPVVQSKLYFDVRGYCIVYMLTRFLRLERALYHLDNHPVKWVRITGVVVAVDEFKGKRVYTVDDSSGMCIECTAIAPPPPPTTDAPTLPPHLNQIASLMHVHTTTKKPADDKTKGDGKMSGLKGKEGKVVPSVLSPAVPWEEVDVGTVVKVKGRVNNYWNTIQLEVIKIEVLRCTDQEVRCWNEVAAFKREVVNRPWVVSEEEEERCRKARERELRHARKGRVERKGGENSAAAEERRKRKEVERREEEEEAKRRKTKEEEKKLKARAKMNSYPSMAVLKAAKGKYDALGI